jgi:signal transduction histidine kinase
MGEANVSGLVLNSDQRQIQFDYFALGFGSGETLRYQYMLEGADKDWSAPSDQRTLMVTLSPGSYRFMVRAMSGDGVISTSPASVSFRILKPLWQRWWVLSLAALMIGGIAYSAFRYRLAQLLRVERVRTRIATDLHDDIGASLSRMAIMSEVVKQQTASDENQSSGLLTEIADSARGLVDSMGDIVWSIDPRRDNLQSAVRRIRQFASDVLEPKGINWELRVPEDVETLKLSADQRRHLFLIFKEGVNNIARHGDGTTSVSLSIKVEGRQLVGEIRDDGCGFVPRASDALRSRESGGNGLPNMQSRAEQLGGRLEITSAPGEGTHLVLRAPIK